MLLIFRFFLVVLRARLRSRIEPLGESRVRFTALPHDCDLNFHLNAGRFLSFMDIARGELIARLRILRPMLKRGWRPVMGGATLRFRRSILPFERFVVRTRVVAWDEKWFHIEHVIERNEQMCAIGRVRMAIRGKDGTVPPRDVLALLGIADMPSPPLPTGEL